MHKDQKGKIVSGVWKHWFIYYSPRNGNLLYTFHSDKRKDLGLVQNSSFKGNHAQNSLSDAKYPQTILF